MKMTPSTARAFWKALMDNAAGLIGDADALLARESYGRARSLTVLAQEELGKALWLYDEFAGSWSSGAEDVREVKKLKTDGRRHAAKYMEAFVFGRDLQAFWGDYGSYDLPEDESAEGWKARLEEQEREAAAASTRANAEKMLGFYVDMDASGDAVLSPADVPAGTIAEDLRIAAQVVEMLLIKDHSRMKFDPSAPYDSTHAQQFMLLPVSHPDEWSAVTEQPPEHGDEDPSESD